MWYMTKMVKRIATMWYMTKMVKRIAKVQRLKEEYCQRVGKSVFV